MVRSNTLGIAVANWVNDNMMTVLPESPGGPGDDDNEGHYRGISVHESYARITSRTRTRKPPRAETPPAVEREISLWSNACARRSSRRTTGTEVATLGRLV